LSPANKNELTLPNSSKDPSHCVLFAGAVS
jgi:hypothetical protein